MPRFYDFEWEGIRVSAKPKGIRRCGLFRFIPYFTGNEPKFKVTMDTISGEQCPFDAKLDFLEPGDSEMTPSMSVSNGQEVKVYPIGASGDHKFQIILNSKGASPRFLGRRNLVTFTAISGDRTTMTIFATLLVVLGGIIGGLIVQFLFGGQ